MVVLSLQMFTNSCATFVEQMAGRISCYGHFHRKKETTIMLFICVCVTGFYGLHKRKGQSVHKTLHATH